MIDQAQTELAISRQLKDIRAIGESLDHLGWVFYGAALYPQAERSLMEAIAIWEKLRVGLEDKEAYRVSLFETQTGTYQTLQQVRVAMQKYPEALEAAEQGRARAFLALLSGKLSRTDEKYAEPKVTFQQLQQIAREQNITIASYSLIIPKTIISDKTSRGNSQLYVWVISPTGKISFRELDLQKWETDNGKSIIEIIEDLQKSLSRPSGTRFSGATNANPRKPPQNYDDSPDELKKLHQLLIKPIEEFLPTDPEAKIVFIPHDALFLVPFAALREQSGKYLIEKHTIAYSPSIQVLAYTEKLRDRTQGSGTLLVGNPTNNLPNAEIEVNAIAQFFKTKAIIGKDATKAAILAKISDARIIHLATHGDFKDKNGLESAIAFADGKLTAADVLQLNLKANLVVLSACNTAKGTITGDGVIGLSRAFILAGTPSIIVTLWFIPDAATGKLMPEFYRNLQGNSDRAQALRQAMLTTMRDYPHPRNWAAFTLIGARKQRI